MRKEGTGNLYLILTVIVIFIFLLILSFFFLLRGKEKWYAIKGNSCLEVPKGIGVYKNDSMCAFGSKDTAYDFIAGLCVELAPGQVSKYKNNPTCS